MGNSIHSVTTRDGVQLRVKDWGQGRPVVLIHGWPLSADSWDDQALALANVGLRVIAYDRRGFGASSHAWSGYDYDSLADDLADVLQATGAQDAALVGFSMGGGEVARYLSRHGAQRVRQAVLVSSVVPYMLKTDNNPDGVPQEVFNGMAEDILADRAKFFAGFFKDFYGIGLMSSPVSNEVVEWSRAVSMQAGLRGVLECAKSFSSTDFRPDLAAFTIPTLIIHGTDDATVPIDTSARAAARGIAGSILHEIEGGPHGLLASHKQQISDELIAFLRGD